MPLAWMDDFREHQDPAIEDQGYFNFTEPDFSARAEKWWRAARPQRTRAAARASGFVAQQIRTVSRRRNITLLNRLFDHSARDIPELWDSLGDRRLTALDHALGRDAEILPRVTLV
jgi:hypothetical protein